MTVHIGQITSEVTAAPQVPDQDTEEEAVSVWAEQARLVALLARARRDRDRTATGDGRD